MKFYVSMMVAAFFLVIVLLFMQGEENGLKGEIGRKIRLYQKEKTNHRQELCSA